MTNSTIKRSSFCSLFSIFSAIATVIILIAGFYPYSEVSEEIVIFIGRFHPLVVHMPIGFVTAVVILQLVALFSKSNLRIAIGTLLWFTMITAILSAIIGTLLAIPGGYDAELLLKHRQWGIATSITCIWMLCAHRSKRRGSDLLYSLALLVCMALIGATGHFGGSLTRGADYLTAYLPEALGGKARPAPIDPGTKTDAALYGRVVQPILNAKCVDCHSEEKTKGDLRMVDLDALLLGGKNGPALKASNAAESLMIERMLLPLDHKEHMPPKGKVQPSEAELELLRWWIDQGAPKRMSLDTEELPADESIALMETALGFAIAAPKEPMLTWEATVQASEPLHHLPQLRIQRVALDSPALDVFFEPSQDSIDALVAQLEPIKANITLLDIGNTTFSEATLKEIGTFSNLEQLRLNNTPVTDEGIQHLASLRQLEKLSLYGTPISDAALDALKKLPKLRQVITWDTDVSYEAAEVFMADMVNANKQRKLQHEIDELKSRLKSLDVEVVGSVIKASGPIERSSADFFNRETLKYGAAIASRASVAVSSTSQFDPPEGLKALVQEKGNELPFSFHTQQEKEPWVRFSFNQPVTLNAISIQNRRDVPEQAKGLILQSSNQDPADLDPADCSLHITNTENTHLTEYPLEKSLRGRYVTMRLSGGNFNPGGNELVLGKGSDKAGEPAATLLGDPIRATASTEFNGDYPVYHLYDGAVTTETVGTSTGLGSQYAGLGPGPHVVVYDMGSTVSFDRIFYAQRPINGGDHVDTIEFWVSDTDPGAASSLNKLLDDNDWQDVWRSTDVKSAWNIDLTRVEIAKRQAKHFRLMIPGHSATLHLQQVLLWGNILPPTSSSITAFDKDTTPTTAATTGQGEWMYEVVPDWGHVPGHDHIGSTHGGIVIDQSGKVYVSTDGPNGIIVYNPDGSFIKTFGEKSRHYHGLNIYQENGQEYIYAAGMNHVAKLDLQGNVILKIEGAKQAPANTWARATAVAVAPNGDLFIADGYGSSVIFKYDKTGTFIKKFGLSGHKEGQFITSHGLTIDARDPSNPLLMVSDRENHRLQCFDLDGNFVNVAINGLRRPCAAAIWKDYVLVAELAGRAVILDKDNQIISVLGDNPNTQEHANFGVPPEHWKDGVFTAPHGCSFDHEGNVYIQDWNQWGRITKLVRKSKILPPPSSIATFNEDKAKFGEQIASRASVAVSSTSQFDPPEGLKALVQEKGNELPFSFHTQQEKEPWVRFSYDQPVTLNAISIQNRRDIPAPTKGIILQSSNQDPADPDPAYCSLYITNTENTHLTEYPLGKSLRGRYVTMRLSGGAYNPGGNELVLGKGSDKAGEPAATLLGDPIRATASTEFNGDYAVDHLYDGAVTTETVGTSTGLGSQYAGLGRGPHVVVYDMGSTVSFDRIFYAQRPINGNDHVDTIEFWVSDTDPGAASSLTKVLDDNGWQDVWTSTAVTSAWNIDLTRVEMAKRQAKHFRLMIPGRSATLHLQQVLLWGNILPPTSSITAFDKDTTPTTGQGE